jgi:phosphate transport system permease protein
MMASSTVSPGEVDLRRRSNRIGERIVMRILFACGVLSILTTLAILAVLLIEGSVFFRNISIVEFFTDTAWQPFGDPASEAFRIGILPLINGTLLVTGIALLVAVPLGLGAAAYLSEYARPGIRKTVKPALEVLAGVPTVVLGYFALTFVTPQLRALLPDGSIQIFNALSAGLVVGVMIVPTIASLSEDAMSAVPNSLRQAAYGMGATRSTVVRKVIGPAALSGIVSAVILGMGRAIGETMIVAIAAGNLPTMTLDPGDQVQTMTGYIVQAVTGEASRGSLTYNSIFAVGLVLFVMTFGLNLIAQRFVKRFREVYS